MSSLDNSVLLITGGTGSFGNEVLRLFLTSNVSEIRIFSRDEKKQDDMRKKYSDARIKFYIGDIRDNVAVESVTHGVDYIFHAAALKQVPSCEFYPIEAVKTNILGTDNLLRHAIRNQVKKVVCLSTDKAVYPINAMGLSKSLMEKVLVSRSREGKDSTIICGTRYGNVMGSRGSVIPLFINQILHKKDLTITNPEMTRFIMSLSEAVELVLFAFKNANPGDIFVQKSPAARIDDLANALLKIFQNENVGITNIGVRHGEKLYETLISSEEMQVAEDLGAFYRIPIDGRDLNYVSYYDEGNTSYSNQEYNSNNTKQLNMSELIELLQNEGFTPENFNSQT